MDSGRSDRRLCNSQDGIWGQVNSVHMCVPQRKEPFPYWKAEREGRNLLKEEDAHFRRTIVDVKLYWKGGTREQEGPFILWNKQGGWGGQCEQSEWMKWSAVQWKWLNPSLPLFLSPSTPQYFKNPQLKLRQYFRRNGRNKFKVQLCSFNKSFGSSKASFQIRVDYTSHWSFWSIN